MGVRQPEDTEDQSQKNTKMLMERGPSCQVSNWYVNQFTLSSVREFSCRPGGPICGDFSCCSVSVHVAMEVRERSLYQ